MIQELQAPNALRNTDVSIALVQFKDWITTGPRDGHVTESSGHVTLSSSHGSAESRDADADESLRSGGVSEPTGLLGMYVCMYVCIRLFGD